MAPDKCDHIIKVAFFPVNQEDHHLSSFVAKLKYAQNLLNGCYAKQQFMICTVSRGFLHHLFFRGKHGMRSLCGKARCMTNANLGTEKKRPQQWVVGAFCLPVSRP
jgi:hypothetical protein